MKQLKPPPHLHLPEQYHWFAEKSLNMSYILSCFESMNQDAMLIVFTNFILNMLVVKSDYQAIDFKLCMKPDPEFDLETTKVLKQTRN